MVHVPYEQYCKRCEHATGADLPVALLHRVPPRHQCAIAEERLTLLQADFARLCLPDYMQGSLVLHNKPISAQQYVQSDSANQQPATLISGSGPAHPPQPSRRETHST